MPRPINYPRLRRLCDYVTLYRRQHKGTPPTFRQMGAALTVWDDDPPVSTSVIHHYVMTLVRLGVATYPPLKITNTRPLEEK